MGEEKNVRLSGIAYESLVNGPGIRRVLFAQGCNHKCKGCFNPETHSFSGGQDFDMDELVKDIVRNPLLRGVTFSGGDPWEQADKFAYMGKKLKEAGKNLWSFTGYTFEYILKHQDKREGWSELLKYIDVLVDGKFIEEKMVEGIKFRGSINQRIIDVQESLRKGEVIVLDFDGRRTVDFYAEERLAYSV